MGSSRRLRCNAPFTIAFALAALLALIVDEQTGGAANRLVFGVYRSSLRDPLAYVRAFAHVLGHSSFEHYAGNVMLMLVLGPGLEERYGSATIARLTAVTALISGAAHCAMYANVMLLGASGVVFMMILLNSAGSARSGEIPLTLVLVALLYIGGELLGSAASSGGVSHMSHVIGGVCGAAFGLARARRGRAR